MEDNTKGMVVMDEMRIKLKTKFMRNIASKLITRAVYKKYGFKVKVQLNDLDVWVIDGDTTVKVNAEMKMNSNDFNKIMESIGMD